MNVEIYQIFFDEHSLRELDPAYKPFDNREPFDRDLFEFSVIYDYFRRNGCAENTFYGFLSPSFENKTAINSNQLLEFVSKNTNFYDAFFFTGGWDQLAFHRNVFTQGEYFHPGFLAASKDFFRAIGGPPDRLINYSSVFDNSVFCNYVVANSAYWKAWLELADKFYTIYRSQNLPSLHMVAQYGKPGVTNAVFLQERLHSILLMDNPHLRVLPYDTTQVGPVLQTIFVDNPLNRKLLRACEAAKSLYLMDNDPASLTMYELIKSKVLRP